MATLEEFRHWLTDRGRTDDTAEEYCKDLKLALDHEKGPLGRLREKKLAPKTLRRNLAALRAWAKFTKDSALAEQLGDIRLPPITRVKAKVPLTKEKWAELLDEVNGADYLTQPERAVIGIMSVRGLRVGDVMRLKRKEVVEGLRTGVLIYVAKGNKRIEVAVKNLRPYLEILIEQGEQWDEVHQLLAHTKKQKGFDSASMAISRALKAVGEKIGIDRKDLSPHILRRTYAVHYAVIVDNALPKLKDHMGWANIQTAAEYLSHNDSKELEDAADDMLSGVIKKKEDSHE